MWKNMWGTSAEVASTAGLGEGVLRDAPEEQPEEDEPQENEGVQRKPNFQWRLKRFKLSARGAGGNLT